MIPDWILKQMDSIGGYFWAEEARQLYEYTMSLPNESLVIESGCLFGRSTSVLATVAKGKKHRFYVIDNWSVEGRDAKPQFWENMHRIGVDNIINFIEKDSPEAAKDFKDQSVNFFHLDTAHDYGHSQKELKAWVPKMKKNAIMCFHDYGNTVFADGIKKAVDETNLIKLGVYNSIGVFRVP